jgi:hypothetical protein
MWSNGSILAGQESFAERPNGGAATLRNAGGLACGYRLPTPPRNRELSSSEIDNASNTIAVPEPSILALPVIAGAALFARCKLH